MAKKPKQPKAKRPPIQFTGPAFGPEVQDELLEWLAQILANHVIKKMRMPESCGPVDGPECGPDNR
jgi:hypothetical protein